jgi:uncharacterized protein YukE
MAINADYDVTSTFTVDPNALQQHAVNLKNYGQAVSDSLKRINDIWDGLKLGWMGKTADEAQDFINRWNAVMQELFGSEKHPEQGVLNAIAVGVATVAANMAFTEHTLFDSFRQFQHSLQGDGSAPSDTPPASITDVTTTTVTEQWG